MQGSVKCLGLSDGIDYELVIYDIFGRSVFSLRPNGGRAGDGGRDGAGNGGKYGGLEGGVQWQINVESYPPGVYIAILKKGLDLVESRKFVIAH